MAINPVMQAALKALSYPDIDIKKSYKLQRQAVNIAHHHYLKPFYKIWDHTVSAGDHNIPVRVFSPQEEGAYPVLLFFHGGGWVIGNIDSYNKVCANMANLTKHIVVSVDYRLAPEHKFPAGLEDCYLVAKELFLHPELMHINCQDITLIGDSAGGNLQRLYPFWQETGKSFSPISKFYYTPQPITTIPPLLHLILYTKTGPVICFHQKEFLILCSCIVIMKQTY